MSILVCECRREMADPSGKFFFTEEEMSVLKENKDKKSSEKEKEPCSKLAYIGIFFDGTNNITGMQ